MTDLIAVGQQTHAGKFIAAKSRSNPSWHTRPYLTQAQVGQLVDIARLNRHGHRDATMIVTAFRHGLRAIDLVDLRWNQIDLRSGRLNVLRAKYGLTSTHAIAGDELRALRRLRREKKCKSKFLFTSHFGKPFTQIGFAKMIERAGIKAEFPFKIHPHMLRHACGYALAEKGYDARALQLYLGHRDARHVERYWPRRV